MRRLSSLALALSVGLATAILATSGAVAAPNDGITFDNAAEQASTSLGAPMAPLPAAAPAPAAVTSSEPATPELAMARGNQASRDLLGWSPSLYQGKWFDAKVEPIRKCIMDRESNFSYTAVGAGTYFGAYQMNRGLAVGALGVMEPEVRKEMGAEGVAILKALRAVAPSKWNRYWQDRAFYTIWHGGDGKRNWQGGGLNCF